MICIHIKRGRGRWGGSTGRRGGRKEERVGVVDSSISSFPIFIHRRLYGAEHMTMKFHMMMHLPEWLERLVTCWALERHHKVVKRFKLRRGSAGCLEFVLFGNIQKHMCC